MVVRFMPPPPPADSGEGPMAPITYLPGAKPRDETGAARDSVEDAQHASAAEPAAAAGGELPRGKKSGARANNVSLHQLARRGMSRWELSQVLQRREVDDATAAAELDRLESVGLLDDAALAVTLVYTQHTRKGLARSAIEYELRRRHIDQDVINDALSEIEDDAERERAVELACKRTAQLSHVDDETARRRLTGFLARKGYSGEIIRAAIAEAMTAREHSHGEVGS